MSLAYRGLDYAAERRFTEAAAGGGAALWGCREVAVFAAERRIARAVAGVVATAGGLGVFALALGTLKEVDAPSRSPAHVLVALLILSGLASVVAYLLARLVARRVVGPFFGREMARSGDPVADLCNLELAGPARALSRFAARIEHASIFLPMAGMSLLMPLTLHSVVSLVTGTIDSYDMWIRFSAVLVGHAHLVLCLCCWRYARFIGRSTSEVINLRGPRDWGRALGFTTLAAAVPGLLVVAIPPVLTVLTGLLFIPFMFNTVRAHVIEERAALSLA